MTKQHPIPDDALDDRIAGVGTSGSGKTYNLGTAIERALELGRRVGVVDPLGVWWGLRLKADGKTASPWPIVIFGGPHGDLPLTENAGQLIGETCARMAESFILDLSELGTRSAERRFMLAFYTALYRHATGEPLTLVTDEADMFAPQTVQDKDGGALKLLGVLETIVRRGRVKGFIPWLITQRPAVLNKNVLSQADGLVAMKLTSSQDRAAIGSWIEGQADKADGKRILDSLPSLKLGQGVVWIPARGILETMDFPRKATFDSSRTPKRGEVKRTHKLKPINVEAIASQLATIEAEVAAGDPVKLKARVAELERQLKAKAARLTPINGVAMSTADLNRQLDAARRAGEAAGFDRGTLAGKRTALEDVRKLLAPLDDTLKVMFSAADQGLAKLRTTQAVAAIATTPIEISPVRHPPSRTAKVYPINGAVLSDGPLPSAQAKILEAVNFWRSVGIEDPTKTQVAAAAGFKVTSSHFQNSVSALRTSGLVEYPSGGRVRLTDSGLAIVGVVASGTVRERLAGILTALQGRMVDALPRSGDPITKAELAAAIGQSVTSSHFQNTVSSLRTIGLVSYPDRGSVAVEPWVWA